VRIIGRKNVDFVFLACDGVWEWGEERDRTTEGSVVSLHRYVYGDRWSEEEFVA
jgi:hypothetical protein